MRGWLVAAAWLTSAALAQAAPRLEIRGLAGQVTIIPEARADIAVGFLGKSRQFPVKVRRSGDLTVIDGGMEHRIKGCPLIDGEHQVRVSGVGFLSLRELPNLVIRTPRNMWVVAGDGVSGVVGRTESLDLENRGCGDWTIANVRGRLRLTQLGAGQLSAGAAGESNLNVAGGGRIAVRQVAGILTAVSTGEGSVYVTEVDGPVVGRVAGSGVIEVTRGGAPEINVQVAGSGAVRFGGSAGAVIASVAGDGEVDVARASGPVTRRIFGPGRIKVGP
ncbi:MAG TPA: hypothetical protein VGG68_13205 [Caulobacteraceae bacterium]|jgi:hypothetical protein